MGLTTKDWHDRARHWRYFYGNGRFARRRIGATPSQTRFFMEMVRKGIFVAAPEDDGYTPPGNPNDTMIIKPGITRMPEFVDPAHAWQTRAWQAMRWHKDGVTARALCAVLGRSTVTLRQMRTWLHLLATRGVVRKTRATGLVGGRFVFTIIGSWKDSPQPPHRYIVMHELEDNQL